MIDPFDRGYVFILRMAMPALFAATGAMIGMTMGEVAIPFGAGIGAAIGRVIGEGCARVWNEP